DGLRFPTSGVHFRLSLGELCCEAPVEAIPGHDEALMGSRADCVHAVMGVELEAGARPPRLDALGLDRHGHAWRRRGLMRHVDMHAEAAFAPIEMRLEEAHPGLFSPPHP